MKRSTITLRAALALPVAVLAAAAVPGPASVAAPGDLDPGFGSGGIAVVDEGVQEAAYATVVQPDGRIILVGEAAVGNHYDALAVRLNADGSRDADFGYRTFPGPPGPYNDSGRAVALQPDGKVVVAGRTAKNQDAAVWRLLPTGAPDPTFGGGDGLVTLDNGGTEYLNDVAIAPDGAIVAVGGSSANGWEAVVYRLTPSGEMDGTFAGDGALGLGNDNSTAYGVAVQGDGRVLVAGEIRPSYGMVVRRLTAGGESDPTFGGGDGEAATGGNAEARDLVVQPDGRIVVAGRIYNPLGNDALLLRYTAGGQPDASYGQGGVVTFDVGGYEELYSVATMPSGGVVASGTSDAGDEAIVVRATAAGRPEVGFGTDGVITLPGSIVYGEGVAAAPDGRIAITGSDAKYSPSAVVYRLLGDYQPPQPQPVVQRCQGKVATIVGTPGKDRIRGTKKADVVVALGGNDVVNGLGGNDLVCAGDGDDTVKGGPGKDDLRGEKGKDRLVGGTGRDKLVGGPQQDSVTQ
jgi:uncharacterized delta-60 repeat protein